MKQFEIEALQVQATALDITITVTHYDINRFSVTISNRVYTNLTSAMSALTTVYLKNNK